MDNIKVHINTLGVVLTIIGSMFVWKFLTTLDFVNYEEYLKGNAELDLKDPNAKDIIIFKLVRFLSKVGISMIVIGGILQIISNYLP